MNHVLLIFIGALGFFNNIKNNVVVFMYSSIHVIFIVFSLFSNPKRLTLNIYQ